MSPYPSSHGSSYYASYLGYASAGYGLSSAPQPCYLVHNWRQRGRHMVCADCGEIQSRGVDVSRRRR